MQEPPSSSGTRPVRLAEATVERLHARSYELALVATLLVAVVVRTYLYGAVFRGDDVVLLANDPYYYRIVVEQHVLAADGVGELVRYGGRDPLLVVALSVAVAAVGLDSAGHVLAWYPVVVGTATVAVVAALARLVTGSRLVSVVAAAALALMPVHASRTALGFSDHHALDYLWLTATATVLLALVVGERWGRSKPTTATPRTPEERAGRAALRVGLTVALALLVAALVLSWVAGLVFVVPAALVVVLWAAVGAASPRHRVVLLLPAFLLAAGIVVQAHRTLGWHDPALVQTTTLLVGLAVVTAGVTAGCRHVGAPRWAALAVSAGVLGGGANYAARISGVPTVLELARAYAMETTNSTITETVSLVGGPVGLLTGPLGAFGFGGFLAFVGLLAVSVVAARRHDPGLVLVAVYAWFFLAFALYQRRFAGELSPFAAVLLAMTLVTAARAVGVVGENERASPHVPAVGAIVATMGVGGATLPPVGRLRQLGPPLFAVVLVLVIVTSSGFLAVRGNQSVTTDSEYEATRAIAAHADAVGRSDAESFVLAPLGDSRRYNYHVADDVRSLSTGYTYAESNYARFAFATNPTAQYASHSPRVGYVVTSGAAPARADPRTMYVRLHERLGTAGDDVDGAGQYRLVYAAPNDAVRAFALVPGAVVTGTAAPGASVTLSTPVAVGDTSFEFRRQIVADGTGRYAARVPYAGVYTDGTRSVTVTETDVLEGHVVATDPADDSALVFGLDAVHDDVVVETTGRVAGVVRGAVPVDGGLRFEGEGAVVVAGVAPASADGFAVSVAFEGIEAVSADSADDRRFNTLIGGSSGDHTELRGFDIGLDDGAITGALGDGENRLVLSGPAVDDGRAHEVTLRWNGSVATLVVDGQAVDSGRYTGRVESPDRFAIGATLDGDNQLYGVVTEVRYVPVDPDSLGAPGDSDEDETGRQARATAAIR